MYGPLLYFGPLRADEVGYSTPVVQSTSDRKDTMTTRITIDHKGLTMAWELPDDSDQGETVVADIMEMLFLEESAQADQVASAVGELLAATQQPPRKRRKMSTEDYQKVAEAWKSAPEGARNKAVRDLLNTSRQNATNYIHRCRALGLLPYPPSRAERVAQLAADEDAPIPLVPTSFAAEIDQILAAE